MPSKTNIDRLIEELKKSPIDGCITGSCLLDNDFNLWQDEPDIDLFVYSEIKWIHAVTWLLDHGYVYGNCKDASKNPEVEEWKFQTMLDKGSDKNHSITTIYLEKDGKDIQKNFIQMVN